jgi:hypothetical protein
MCQAGNRGPLCSSCEQSWTYSAAERACIQCSSSHERAAIILGVGAGLVFVLLSLYVSGYLKKMPNCIRKSPVLGTLRQIDSGAFRVLWSNYQVHTFTSSFTSLLCNSVNQFSISPLTLCLLIFCFFSFLFLQYLWLPSMNSSRWR